VQTILILGEGVLMVFLGVDLWPVGVLQQNRECYMRLTCCERSMIRLRHTVLDMVFSLRNGVWLSAFGFQRRADSHGCLKKTKVNRARSSAGSEG
jgi:hypothetical protein